MDAEKPDRKSAGEEGRAGKPTSGRDQARRRRMLRWGVLGLAVLVALIAWLATRGGDESSTEPAPATAAAPRIVTEAELREAAAELGQPVFWAGPMAGRELELRELGEGRGVQVVYLPEGTPVGQDLSASLTIGSYPLPDPGKAVEGYAGRPGSKTIEGAGGREVVTSEQAPGSAYFAAPDNSVQVEVYDPSSRRALTLAVSGQVKPVE